MSTRLDAVMQAAGFNQADLDRWVAERDPWNLDDWLAANPTPHTDAQAAELAEHLTHRQQLVDEYRASHMPADFAQRVQEAIAADAARWHAEQLTVDARREAGEIAPPGGNPAYVTRALEAEFGRLAAAVEGHRNDQLLKTACSTFELVKGGHVSEPGAWAELRRVAAAIGLQHNEIEATLRSAWHRVGPRSVPAPTRHSSRTTFHVPGVI